MTTTVTAGDVASIAVAAIAVPATHARRRMDGEGLDSLARSIAEHGLLQPVVVRPLGGGRYELLAGARRLRAMRDLGEMAIPALVRQSEPAEVLSLIENTQREGLDALELAEALQRLAAKGWDRLALGRLVNRSLTWVGDVLSLNGLPDAIKADYPEVRRVVPRSLLVEIARVRDPETQMALWAEARGGALTVRAARTKRLAARPALPRALSAVRRCVKQLDRLDGVPELKARDRGALLALRERIDALLSGERGALGPS
ncbi:ParB/RepB/Spo0J family partition protein [Azospirillum sp.]|uniref:ParB/RepB/Spo0J family partition protein n=1 Tax=Azospirillum sp. TaxID=34012 RepID=UPI003D73EB7B